MQYFIQYIIPNDKGFRDGVPVALFAFEDYSNEEVATVADYHYKRLIKKGKVQADSQSTCKEVTLEQLNDIDVSDPKGAVIKNLKIKEFKKLTSIQDYIIQSSRTRPSLGMSKQEAAYIDLDVLHYRMGFVTEIGELVDIFKRNIAYGEPDDEINAFEEYGDIWWYMACLTLHYIEVNHVNKEHYSLDNFEKIFHEELNNFIKSPIQSHTVIQSLMIKAGQFMAGSISTSYVMAYLTRGMQDIYPNFNLFRALQNNVDKLKVRYENGFTAEEALARDLESERIQLEKGKGDALVL